MYERTAKLVERLLEKTKGKALVWEKNPKDHFQTSFPSYTVELSEDEDFDKWIHIYNDEGDVLEAVSDKTLMQQAGLFDRGLDLSELYSMARRSALGSDEAIERLISALED